MKSRKFKIKIRSTEEWKKETIQHWKSAERGEPDRDRDYELVLGLPDISSLSKIFSPERIRLIQAVREHKPKSILHLSQILDRAQPNVQKDVRELADMGILELQKGEGEKTETLQPRFNWDGFDVAV